MAEDRIDVVFGAKVAELLAGVQEAHLAIEGLRAAIDTFVESLSGPHGGMRDTLRKRDKRSDLNVAAAIGLAVLGSHTTQWRS